MKFPSSVFFVVLVASLLSPVLFAGPATPLEPTNAAEAKAKAKAAAAAEAEVAEKYDAWVATLTPPHQAWEKILQENLGDFYLPLHQADKVKGRANAWDFVEDDSALPRVLIIGDSVSRGYTMTVRRSLAGKANLHRAPANCGPTRLGLEKLDVWLGQGKWDLIHFNFGIHDRATPLSDYEIRLSEIVERLSATGAKLVWASTTPVPDSGDGKLRSAAIVERNAIAEQVMREKGVLVNDLYSAVEPQLSTLQNPDDVHFTPEGYRFLGEKVSQFIAGEL